MRMRSAQGTISDIKMVVHQHYEWIIEGEVFGRDDRRCQVSRPYEPRGQFRNVVNAANMTLVRHCYLPSRTLDTVCPGTIRCRRASDQAIAASSASCWRKAFRAPPQATI